MAEPHAVTAQSVQLDAGPGHAAPNFYGVTAPMFIALAMVVVIGLLLWGKAHRTMVSALDKKIALIRDQLTEAEDLRKEAEALKAEYEAKAMSVEKERKALLARAKKEADEIVENASRNAETMVERRGRMAEEKIAAEERAAIDQLRATAANAARLAAGQLITDRLDDKGDKALVDEAISGLSR